MPLETMLRVYFLQNWYALSDPMAEETLYDSEAMRRFAGIELGDDRIPDKTTILNFRHLLERHGQTVAIFVDVNDHLADQGITLRTGTLVDATIIDAPSSTKNKAKARVPEMSSTKKGNIWYFGMKAPEQLLMPRPWFSGRVVLIGDAVHATTPHMAAGAMIGMEDAVVLADEIAARGIAAALPAFQDRRWERCRLVVENSGRLAEIEQGHGTQEEHQRLMGQTLGALAMPA